MKNLKENKTVLILYAIIILILCVAIFEIVYLQKQGKEGRFVRVYLEGTLTHEIDLRKIEEPYTLELCGDDGEENIVRITREGAEMVSASCPDQLCVKMGFTHDETMPITCMPNRVVIVVSDDTQSEDKIDGVAY